MPEIDLNVPKEELPELRALVSAESDQLKWLADALRSAQPRMRWQDVVGEVAATDVYDPVWVRSASALVWRLNAVRSQSETTAEEFVAALTAALLNLCDDCWTLEDRERWSVAQPLIHELLDSRNALAVAAKALDLVTEQPIYMRSSRIITDLRPVFDDDASKVQAFACFHTLALKCVAGSEERDIHVALDDADLEELLKQVQRALRKSHALRATCAAAGPPVIVVADGVPAGGETNGCSTGD